LPEKALDLLDEAASSVRASNGQPPRELGETWRKLRDIRSKKEDLVSKGMLDRAEKLRAEEENLKHEYQELSNEAVKITSIVAVSRDAVAKVVAERTGIPVASLSSTEAEKLLNMEEEIKKRIVGQERAISSLAKSLRRARTGLAAPNRPIGVFLFLGPTGVGKTETAKVLTEFLFGDKGKLLRLDMSDFMEKHNVSRLIGAPPGYVGYFEGGELTEKIRQNPYSVVLFDEIEKAHPDVLDILLQISEEGELKDARSRLTDFKNTIIILTSNIGAGLIKKGKLGFNIVPDDEDEKEAELEYSQMRERLLNQLKKQLKPEFLNRLDEVVVFRPLSKNDILSISDLHIKEVQKRLKRKNIVLDVTYAAKEILAEQGYSEEYGARPLRRTVEDKLANPVSEMILRGELAEGGKVKVRGREGKLVFETG
jgi:ATP-dependent Clp protease ATP-binding subunit ClpC